MYRWTAEVGAGVLAHAPALERPFVSIGSRLSDVPGVGRLYLDSLNYQDYTVILGLLLVTSVMVVAGSLLADLFYAVADPRIRLG